MVEETSEKAKWYVIHTHSGYENKVASNLRKIVENRQLGDLIQEICVPTEIVIEIRDNKRYEVERKLYPGYVCVKMVLNDDTWHVVRSIRGSINFVGSDKPTPLSDKEAAAMGIIRESVEVNYSEGDSVRIANGPLMDFVGTVDKIDKEKNIVNVTVSMFGRNTPVELELDQVEIIEG